MRYLLYCLLGMVLPFTLFAQQALNGTTTDSQTNKPLPFVNIGILNTSVGTVSDQNGHFMLPIPEKHRRDSITFSYIGYETKSFSLLKPTPKTFELTPTATKLPEIVVKPTDKWKTKWYGNKMFFYSHVGAVVKDSTRFELGQYVNLGSTRKKVNSFHVKITSNQEDSALVRIHLYRFDSTQTSESLLQKPIQKRVKLTEGWLDITLDEYNIWLDGKIMMGIEFLPNYQSAVSYYIGASVGVGSKKSYSRRQPFEPWKPDDTANYCMYLTTRSLK